MPNVFSNSGCLLLAQLPVIRCDFSKPLRISLGLMSPMVNVDEFVEVFVSKGTVVVDLFSSA